MFFYLTDLSLIHPVSNFLSAEEAPPLKSV